MVSAEVSVMHITDYYVVEWSPSQNSFHLQTVAEMIQKNLDVLIGKSIADYICIGVFETYKQASDSIQKLMKIRDITTRSAPAGNRCKDAPGLFPSGAPAAKTGEQIYEYRYKSKSIV